MLKEQLVIAHRDAPAAGERQASPVYGVFLHTHRQYRLTADHLVGHVARWPADEPAGLMLGAFSSCGDAAYRARGDALLEERAAVARPDSWPWMSRAAADERSDFRDVLAPVVRASADGVRGRRPPARAAGTMVP
ncbi:hypothetical protein ACFRMN_04915 [Streptomyces sp. NPDC056835]|uniref:hypothetical protein n=1 Tax=Streptomyces sp. NPDC056835 TaxID=3345956 RepID=UPI00369230BB